MLYQAIPTTNYVEVPSKSVYKDIKVKRNTAQQKTPNMKQTPVINSDAEEMFGSSEIATNQDMLPKMSKRVVQESTYGFEPRVPTVTVNPQIKELVVDIVDTISATGSLMMTKGVEADDDKLLMEDD